ncbi:MAG: transglutaminase family protein [Chryseolinea sp.]
MSKFKIRHVTKYSYETMVRDSANQIMLYPIKDASQQILQHTILITGNPVVDLYFDSYGNQVGTFTQASPHQELIIDSRLLVETFPRPIPDDTTPQDLQWLELTTLRQQLEYIDFLRQERFSAFQEIEKIVETERCQECSPLVTAKHFCEYIYKNFEYKKGITTVESTIDEVWNLRSGVCQDFAHVLLVMLRLINIPARYVSGYICPKKNGMRGEGATHAWVEAYIPFYGWLGLDPTNNSLATEAHVTLAVGKNFSDCSPVKGTYRGTSNHTLDVAVSVGYEDGITMDGDHEIVKPDVIASNMKNSFRRHQEMQMQQ